MEIWKSIMSMLEWWLKIIETIWKTGCFCSRSFFLPTFDVHICTSIFAFWESNVQIRRKSQLRDLTARIYKWRAWEKRRTGSCELWAPEKMCTSVHEYCETASGVFDSDVVCRDEEVRWLVSYLKRISVIADFLFHFTGAVCCFFVSASVYIDGGQKISEFVENQSIYEQPGLWPVDYDRSFFVFTYCPIMIWYRVYCYPRWGLFQPK